MLAHRTNMCVHKAQIPSHRFWVEKSMRRHPVKDRQKLLLHLHRFRTTRNMETPESRPDPDEEKRGGETH